LPYSIWGTRHLIIVFSARRNSIGNRFIENKISAIAPRRFDINFFACRRGVSISSDTQRAEIHLVRVGKSRSELTQTNNQPAKIYVFEDLVAIISGLPCAMPTDDFKSSKLMN
jgi:hypothetical protein